MGFLSSIGKGLMDVTGISSVGNMIGGESGGGDWLKGFWSGIPILGAGFQNQMRNSMQLQAWGREDNAVQRRVKDLVAAGLSPTLAAGSAAAAGAPISTSTFAPSDEGGIGAIMAVMKAKQDISTSAAQEDLLKLQGTKTYSDTMKNLEMLENIRADRSGKEINNASALQDLIIQKETGTTSNKGGLAGLLKDAAAATSGFFDKKSPGHVQGAKKEVINKIPTPSYMRYR